MARYIVNYADGQSVTIPIYSEIDIENYSRKAQSDSRRADGVGEQV
jgi:hypothetical protein